MESSLLNGWDDYKGVDVRGKTIVMLINDPAVPDAADATKLDAKMFKGNAMTYYGRWTYKYEIASAKGAAAAILIHETAAAGYPYEVVSGSWSRRELRHSKARQEYGTRCGGIMDHHRSSQGALYRQRAGL